MKSRIRVIVAWRNRSSFRISEKASSCTIMDACTGYTQSLRGKDKVVSKVEEGVPFFVPQLSKVKTSSTCTKAHPYLLLVHEDEVGHHDPGISYRKQGDPTMYTENNVARRQEIRNDVVVVEMLNKFWETLSPVRNGKAALTQKEYVNVFLKMYKALTHPEEFCIIEGRKIVKRDWAHDCAESNTMSKHAFLKSLFEVADIWTTSTDPVEYSSFLERLFLRITMTVYDQDRAVYLRKFAHIDAILSFYDAITGDKIPALHSFKVKSKAIGALMSGLKTETKPKLLRAVSDKAAIQKAQADTKLFKRQASLPSRINVENAATHLALRVASEQKPEPSLMRSFLKKRPSRKRTMPKIHINPTLSVSK